MMQPVGSFTAHTDRLVAVWMTDPATGFGRFAWLDRRTLAFVAWQDETP